MRAHGTMRTTAAVAAAIAWGALAALPAGAADMQWSVKKLPGCDDLPQRMAQYYKPVAVDFTAAAPAYKLPVDLAKLTNTDITVKVYELRRSDEARKRLTGNGFVAVAPARQDDVARFYDSLKQRGLPIFITSDSLLHLYHVQFDETLRDIEERAFYQDAQLICNTLQTQAMRAYLLTQGELKAAARLLAGYLSVPVALLGQVSLGGDAAEALKEVETWPPRGAFDKVIAFRRNYTELLEVMCKEQKLDARRTLYSRSKLKAALKKYIDAHPPIQPQLLIPEPVRKKTMAELALIEAHKGFAPSPLFTYREDYSQYVPRGHYTRSRKLQQYFKALMWLGRMTFLIRGRTLGVDGIVPMPEARKQTFAAALLAGMMEYKMSDGRTVAEAWDRLYAVTAYYVGLADDLTPYDYRAATRGAIGEAVSASALTEAAKFFDLRKRLAEMRKPQIYSGLGDLEGPPPEIADEKTLAQALAKTQGMRLMGQRYIPDSYMLGKLVYPTVGKFTGQGRPFTLVVSDAGPIRGFPRGLDVMAVLGSDRARHWLKKLGDDAYQKYGQTLAKLTGEFGKIDQADWNRNMYWSWLYTLKALLKEYSSGYPTFMQSEAWRDKQLSAALASWAQLRHDTILYAKQSYTMKPTAAPMPPKMVEGYVEPVPEFYARLLALTRMTLAGLKDFNVLNEQARNRLTSLEQIVARLLAISRQELTNQKLTKDDYAFIRSFGARLKSVVAGVNSEGLQTTIVADVHTDANSKQVLEEGTGHLHRMVVVYPMPDGGLVAGVGPVLSHYELKHPMSDRLTDEAWKKMLRGRKGPALPAWGQAFTVTATRSGSKIPLHKVPQAPKRAPIRRRLPAPRR